MEPGAVIAERFECEALAGSGGMGVVYRARDRMTGQPVALKFLRGVGRELGERFAREAQILSELSHPGIVSYVADGVTPDGYRWLAMQWLDGEDLAARLERGRLTVEESVALGRRVAAALAACHARGVVHRDLKPSNLFLPDRNLSRVVLLDFGIARPGEGAVRNTRTGVMMGTLGYMAPEQARGARDVDARADVFSLGCVLYETLTGLPPFRGDNVLAVLAKILLQETPQPSELQPGIPPTLDALVRDMLAKLPAGRPADAAAVLAALDRLDERAADAPAEVVPATLTRSEQRLLAVVVAGVADVARAETTPPEALTLPDTLGVNMERLIDGSMLAYLESDGVATDLAGRAARCALALHAVLPTAPIALATGRGVLTSRLPVGEVIDRAARLLPAAPEILVDDLTAVLLDARFDVEGGKLRGEREPLDSLRTLAGKPTSCVGRDRELATLEAAYSACVDEPSAQVVIAVAGAGVGKSRIRHELLRRLVNRDDAPEIWIGRGDPMSAGVSLGLIAQALRRFVGLRQGEPLAERRERLRLHLGHLDREVVEFIGEIVGAPFPDDASVQLRTARRDAMLMGDQMRRAFETLLATQCATRPLVIVLEDLHWGDLPTVKFIDSALRALADRPLFVFALARPEVHELFPELWTERGVQEVRLRELPAKAGEKLAREVLGERATPALCARLVELAAGNAFYLEELIRAAAEGRTALPDSVLAMVQARLDALPDDQRRLLRAASVFGQVFWHGAAEALLGGAADALAPLVEKEYVTRRNESKLRGEVEYVFRHNILREAAYASLTDADRVLGHRLAGEWLERTGNPDPLVVAEHYESGGTPGRAVDWFVRAAGQALAGNDFAATIARARRGLAAGAAGEARAALELSLAEAQRWSGEFPAAAEHAARARDESVPGSVCWCVAVGELVAASGGLGRTEDVLATCQALAFVEPATDAIPAFARSVKLAAFHAGHAQDMELADLLLGRLTAFAAGRDDPGIQAELHRARGSRAAFIGDTGTYLKEAELALDAYMLVGDLRRVADAHVGVGFGYALLGRPEQAERSLRQAESDARRMGLRQVSVGARQNLGLALLGRGALDEAGRLEEATAIESEAAGNLRLAACSRVYLALVRLAAGDTQAAVREAQTALSLAQSHPALLAYAAGTLATALLREGRADEALATARSAMALIESLGALEEGEALCRLVHAEALEATGEGAAARAAIAVARDRVHSAAERIADRDLRRSFLENVQENVRTLALATAWGVS